MTPDNGRSSSVLDRVTVGEFTALAGPVPPAPSFALAFTRAAAQLAGTTAAQVLDGIDPDHHHARTIAATLTEGTHDAST